MSDTPVSLASLMTPNKTVTIEYPGYVGMTVDICYQSREELVKMRKKCTTTKWDKKKNAMAESTNEDKFLTNYCTAVIRDWSGLKYRYLEELLLVDTSAQDLDDCIAFSPENAEVLMKNSTEFDTWVTETVGDLENFTSRK